jgi:hypothetical protein
LSKHATAVSVGELRAFTEPDISFLQVPFSNGPPMRPFEIPFQVLDEEYPLASAREPFRGSRCIVLNPSIFFTSDILRDFENSTYP